MHGAFLPNFVWSYPLVFVENSKKILYIANALRCPNMIKSKIR